MLLFSDLHLSPRTYDTCMQVLRRVHSEAVQRNLPVGFLGDFFDKVHSQGTLPVNILNELMRFFETEWSVPMIMIPGNHDYFDAAETEHGLTPFAYASTHIRVLDEPTVIDRQLWVPWRRSPETIAAILKQHSDVDAILGHFDIVGFKMSHSRLSTEGVQPSDFPVEIPVYSGHYHTPQSHGNIRYLGSPYQLTLSEAGDEKALVVIQNGQVTEQIAIDIGAHQYKWSAAELLRRAHELRPNDRVSVESDGSAALSSCIDALTSQSVVVQVKRSQKPVETRISDGDNMQPHELLVAYSKLADIDQGSSAWCQLSERVLSMPTSQQRVRPDLRPVKIKLEGFGPFTGPITVSLEGQGLTLISGVVSDSTQTSNGAGKSLATAGAWLWCLTGMTDGRPALPFDSASIVNQEVGRATVTAEGTVNGQAWSVTRSMAPKKHVLKVRVDGQDLTRSTLNGTQRCIGSVLFGMEVSGRDLFAWLVRNSVWSQHVVTRWLDANDAAAKAEIHDLANVSIWTELHAWAKAHHKTQKHELEITRANQKTATRLYDTALDTHVRNTRLAEEWETLHLEKIAERESNIEKTRVSYRRGVLSLSDDTPEPIDESELVRTSDELVDARVVLTRMVQRHKDLKNELPTEWQTADYDAKEHWWREQPDPKPEVHATHKQHCHAAKHARHVQLQAARKEHSDFQSAGFCATCKRPFDKDENHHEHARQLHERLEAARAAYADANAQYVDAQQKHIHSLKLQKTLRQTREYIDKGRSFQKLNSNIGEAHATLDRLVAVVRQMTAVIDKKKRRLAVHRETKMLCDELKATIETCERGLARMRQETNPYDTSDANVRALQEECRALDTQIQECQQSVAQWASILLWTGPRGIQTYALEHTVKTLARNTTLWLCKLFNTEHIRLRVFFDEKERLQRIIEYKDHHGVLSGGQWRRAQLAAFMAWRETENFPLLIMDEACTSMDLQGIHAVQNTLRDWCEEDDRRTCFFISHEPEQHRDKSVYHNHTRILHKRGRSTIADDANNKRQRK